jgi:hypothetical protein
MGREQELLLCQPLPVVGDATAFWPQWLEAGNLLSSYLLVDAACAIVAPSAGCPAAT